MAPTVWVTPLRVISLQPLTWVHILLGPRGGAVQGMHGSWLLSLSTTHITGCPVCDDACTQLPSHYGLLLLPRSAPTLCCKNTPFRSTELVCSTMHVDKLFLLSPLCPLCALTDQRTPAQVPSPWEASLSLLGRPPPAAMLSGPVCSCCWALGSRKTGTKSQHPARAHRMETEWEDGYMARG